MSSMHQLHGARILYYSRRKLNAGNGRKGLRIWVGRGKAFHCCCLNRYVSRKMREAGCKCHNGHRWRPCGFVMAQCGGGGHL